MKKFVSLVLALMMVLSCGCALAEIDVSQPIPLEQQLANLGNGDLTVEDIAGDWRTILINAVEYGEETEYDPEIFVSLLRIVINADGTGTIFENSNTERPVHVYLYNNDDGNVAVKFATAEGEFSIEGLLGTTATVQDLPVYLAENTYALFGDDYFFVLDDEYDRFFMSKNWQEIQWLPANPDVAREDFAGTWRLTASSVMGRRVIYGIDGQSLRASRTNLSMSCVRHPGFAMFAITDRIVNGWVPDDEFPTYLIDIMEFENGVMIGEDLNSPLSCTMTILEDGSLLVCFNEIYCLNFVRAE